MRLAALIKERLLSLVGKRAPKIKTAGSRIDSGRDAFVFLKSKEAREKRSLLRKINTYRMRRKVAKDSFFQKKSRTNGLRLLFLVVILGLAITLFVKQDGFDRINHLFTTIDSFHLTSVRVEGCVHSIPEKVREYSGIVVSSSLFALDDEHVLTNIKRADGWVKDVNIIRKWPDEVILKVQEYKPVALIGRQRDDEVHLYYMDENGVPFIKVKAGMDLDYPIVTGLELQDKDKREQRIDEVLTFLSLIGENNPNLPAQSVSEIHVSKRHGLIVYTVEYPFPIFFGDGDVRKKYNKLRKVLEKLYKYTPRKNNLGIADVAYIRMDYQKNKVLVGYSRNIGSG